MPLRDDLAAASRLSRDWAEQMLPGGEREWPRTVVLHPPTVDATSEGLQALSDWASEVDAAARRHELLVERRNRRIGTIAHPVPHRLIVPSLEHSARLAADDRMEKIDTARARLARLGSVRSAPTLRSVVALSDLDFELLLAVLHWLRVNDEAGMTTRQLPIEGVHGKWLDSHGKLVEQLLGRPLIFAPRTHTVQLAWLDPQHRRSGRQHDSYSVGDRMAPPYPVRLAIVIENKDTVTYFPPVAGAVAILGKGKNLPVLADIPWLDGVPIVYWGDIDAAGYGIVHQLREQGLPVATILMDEAAAERYARLGVRHHPNGALINERRRNLDHLEPGERAVYERLTDPERTEWLRIEQERIPLGHAAAALAALGY